MADEKCTPWLTLDSFLHRCLSSEEEQFIDFVHRDIGHFLRCFTVKSVLLFPPLSSFHRLLIHKAAEEYQQLHTFSVGQGQSRRTTVCLREDLNSCSLQGEGLMSLNRPPSARGRGRGRWSSPGSQSDSKQQNRPRDSLGTDDRNRDGPRTEDRHRDNLRTEDRHDQKSPRGVDISPISHAPASRRGRGQNTRTRNKRPDAQIYVPRGRRQQQMPAINQHHDVGGTVVHNDRLGNLDPGTRDVDFRNRDVKDRIGNIDHETRDMDLRNQDVDDRIGNQDHETRDVDLRNRDVKDMIAKLDHETRDVDLRNQDVDDRIGNLGYKTRDTDLRNQDVKDRIGNINHRTRDVDFRNQDVDNRIGQLDDETMEMDFHNRDVKNRIEKQDHETRDVDLRNRDVDERIGNLGHETRDVDFRNQDVDDRIGNIDHETRDMDLRNQDVDDRIGNLDPETRDVDLRNQDVDDRIGNLDHGTRDVDLRVGDVNERIENIDYGTRERDPRNKDVCRIEIQGGLEKNRNTSKSGKDLPEVVGKPTEQTFPQSTNLPTTKQVSQLRKSRPQNQVYVPPHHRNDSSGRAQEMSGQSRPADCGQGEHRGVQDMETVAEFRDAEMDRSNMSGDPHHRTKAKRVKLNNSLSKLKGGDETEIEQQSAVVLLNIHSEQCRLSTDPSHVASVSDIRVSGPSVSDIHVSGPIVSDIHVPDPSVSDINVSGPSVSDIHVPGPCVPDPSVPDIDDPAVSDISSRGGHHGFCSEHGDKSGSHGDMVDRTCCDIDEVRPSATDPVTSTDIDNVDTTLEPDDGLQSDKSCWTLSNRDSVTSQISLNSGELSNEVTTSDRGVSDHTSTAVQGYEDGNDHSQTVTTTITEAETKFTENTDKNQTISHCKKGETQELSDEVAMITDRDCEYLDEECTKVASNCYTDDQADTPQYMDVDDDLCNDDEEKGEDSWDKMFDDEGECLDPVAMEELTSAIGKVKIKKPIINYLTYKPREPDLSQEDMGHVIEIYDFSEEFKTEDLVSAFQQFKSKGFDIKWVDDTHALGVFNSVIAAQSALSLNHPLLKVRAMSEAARQSKEKAKRCVEFLLPYKARPETSVMTARRLVTGALGLAPRVSREQRDLERQKLRQAKEKKKLMKKQKDDIWEGTYTPENVETS